MGGMDKIAWLMSIQITSLTSRRDSRWDRSHPWGKHPKLSKTVKNCWLKMPVQNLLKPHCAGLCAYPRPLRTSWVINPVHTYNFQTVEMVQNKFFSWMTLVCMCIWIQMKNLWSEHMRAMSTSDNEWCNFSNEDDSISYKDASSWLDILQWQFKIK